MTDVERVQKLIQKGRSVLGTHKPNPPGFIGFPTLDAGAFSAWKAQCLNFLETKLPQSNSYVERFKDEVTRGFNACVNSGVGILESLKEDLEAGNIGNIAPDYTPLHQIENICERFHLIARQMRSRHEDRETLDVQDEYDVQNLLHSLLLLHFNDIRPEEWTPSYAGKTSRMDFLLKNEQIVIEVKKTRKGLKAKELGSQLIEDIARYENHPNCDLLICFVYDPDGMISNPRGIENDLRRPDAKLRVTVLIRP